MKRSTAFLMCLSLVVMAGLFSLPSTVLAEKSWSVPTAQEASATIGSNGVVNTDVTNWVTGEVSRVSLAGVTVNQQPFTATPVRWFKKFKEKLKGEQGEPGPPGADGANGVLSGKGTDSESGIAGEIYQRDTRLAQGSVEASSTVSIIAECDDSNDISIGGACSAVQEDMSLNGSGQFLNAATSGRSIQSCRWTHTPGGSTSGVLARVFCIVVD